MIVRLEPHEIRYARYVGALRTAARKDSQADRNKQIGLWSREKVDAIGALGELAACKGLNVYWQNAFYKTASKEKLKRPDVGGFEVKTTLSFPRRLWVYDDTPIDAKLLLVCNESDDDSVWKLCGWQWAKECRKPEYRDETLKIPCWAYPKEKLNSI